MKTAALKHVLINAQEYVAGIGSLITAVLGLNVLNLNPTLTAYLTVASVVCTVLGVIRVPNNIASVVTDANSANEVFTALKGLKKK